jgi:repressor LexA
MPRGSFLPLANDFILDPRFGPEMVRRRARVVFDYYLLLLRRLHESEADGARIEVRSSELAPELDLGTRSPAATINRCNHQLATKFGLVRYDPAPGRAPVLELLDPRDPAHAYRPPEENYFALPLQYWHGGWDRALGLKAKFFLLVSIHEHGRNAPKREAGDGPRYWFRSVEDLAARYHVAARTVTAALKELWKAGILGIERGSYAAGRANRYYYRDIAFTPSYRARFDELAWELGEARYAEARALAARLDAENRPEAIALMAELVDEHGRGDVAAAVEMLADRSLRSPVRTPEYVRGILRNWRAASDEGPMMVREVPYLGYVAAGPPALAEEQALGTIRARVPRTAAGPLFALRVSGDSMVGAGIQDGDYVIVAGRPVAENGDIVLALLNGESTVKRLVRRDGYTALQPENEKYGAMLVGPGDELVIQGKVVATTRSKRPPDSPPPL